MTSNYFSVDYSEFFPASCPTETEVREDLYSYISDTYKDIHGFRPRGYFPLESMSMAELEGLCEKLSNDCRVSVEAERVYEAKCRANFENMVSTLMVDHSIDRETAVCWLIDAEDEGEYFTMDSFLFHYNLGYDYNVYTGSVNPTKAYIAL